MGLWDKLFGKKQKNDHLSVTELKPELHESQFEEPPIKNSDLSSQYDFILTNDCIQELKERKMSFSEAYPTVHSIYIQLGTDLSSCCHFDNGFFQNCHQLETVVFDPAWKDPYGDGFFQLTSAFKNCTALKKVVLPDTMHVLDREMFKGCTALKEIYLPDAIEEIGDTAFENCYSLQELLLPKNIRTIYREAFKNCSQLRKVTILSEKLEYLSFSMFDGCDALEVFEMPDQKHLIYLHEIPPQRFLREISPGFYALGNILAQYIGEDQFVEIPPNIEYIGGECFRNNKKICRIKMSEKVRIIGSNAFRACKKLKQCEMPGVEYIGYGAFATSGIESVIFPKLKNPPTYLFENCKHLERVVFPDSYSETYFGDSGRMFTNCENLIEVQRMPPFRTISKAAFQNCQKLESIVLSEGTEVIGNAAFQNCCALYNVELPTTLRVIEPNAFLNTALKELRLPDNMEKISLKATESVTFIVTEGSVTHQYCVTKKLPFVLVGRKNETAAFIKHNSGTETAAEVTQDFSEPAATENTFSGFDDEGSLTLTYPVVGTDYSPERTSTCESLKKGDSILLEREPDNDYDPFAIMVKSKENKQCGYLPAELAKWLAVVLDAEEVQISHATVKQIILRKQNGNRRKYTSLKIDIQVHWNPKKYVVKMHDNESEIFLFEKKGEEILPAELYREDDDVWDEYKTYCLLVGEINLPADIDYELDDEDE